MGESHQWEIFLEPYLTWGRCNGSFYLLQSNLDISTRCLKQNNWSHPLHQFTQNDYRNSSI